MNSKTSESNYRWYVAITGAVTHAFAIGLPMMSLPVLFKEISEDLDLSLVQIGTAWGLVNLAATFVVLVSGLLGDRFGAKRTLTVLCFLGGLTVASIGLTNSFYSLAAAMFTFGLLNAGIPVNVHKAVSAWFSRRQLGLANGIAGLGMGGGQVIGAMIAATVLSPLLGGWRHVMFFNGALLTGMSIFWLLSRNEPNRIESPASSASTVPFRQALSKVVHIKNSWCLGFVMLCQVGGFSGVIGYLPIYLRNTGWTTASADGTLAVATAVGLLVTIPVSLWSDKLGSRKTVLWTLNLVTVIGIGLLSIVSGPIIWGIAIIALLGSNAFPSLCVTATNEIKGIGVIYAGTALGLVMTFMRFGGAISPPLGNMLASTSHPSLPFVFWAALSALASIGFYFLKEERRRKITEITITSGI